LKDEKAPRGRTETKPVGFWEAFWFWVKLGFINFGGPAGQIAIMHRELVEKKRWVSEGQYLRTLNFCMLLPGPEAQQVATYIGWRLHGTLGGVVAGSFFVIPSIFVLWLLSYLAVTHSDVPAIRGLLYGVQPVVIAIVVEAVLRIARRALNHYLLIGFSVAAFVALFFPFRAPPARGACRRPQWARSEPRGARSLRGRWTRFRAGGRVGGRLGCILGPAFDAA
jgi:chromate transporter